MANYVLDKGYLVNTGQTVTFGIACVATDPTHVSVAGAAVSILGVFQETLDAAKIATGKATVNVRLMGITRMVAGGAVAVMDRVKTDASGRAVTNAGGTLAFTCGIALSAATTTGDWIDVLLTPGTKDAAS